jgi:general secretion pathway protein G
MKSSKRNGFTLVELLVVVGILGILAVLAIPNMLSALNRARNKQTFSEMRSLGTALEAYRVDHYAFAVRAQANPEPVADTLSGILDALGYFSDPPLVDGWGNPLLYSNRASDVALYSLGSGGADMVFASAADLAVNPLPPQSMGSETSHNWDCDIAFADGQFIFGSCE